MTNPNDSTFPCTDTIHPETHERCLPLERGLTKREYFAAMAMQGLLAASWNTSSNKIVTSKSVTIADELINALNQQQ